MKNIYRYIFLLLLPAGIALAQSAKEEEGAPFFEKDYAKNPLADQVSPTVSQPTAAPTVQSSQVEQSNNIDPILRSVRSVGAVVNCADREHCFTNLREIADFATENRVPLNSVFIIGKMSNLSEPIADFIKDPSLHFAFANLSGALQIVSEPPPAFDLQRSPAWLIEADEGWIVMEAMGGIAQFFNEDGKFVDKYSSVNPAQR